MKREHTISWDKVPKHRIIQLLLGLMAKRPICRRGTVVYCTFPVNNCRRTGLGLRGIGKVTERNLASLLKKHFIALRFEHYTMKIGGTLAKKAKGRKIPCDGNNIGDFI